MYAAVANVATDRAERYAKQLTSHLGRKCAVEQTETGTRLTLPTESGTARCLLVSGTDALALHAEGGTPEELEQVKDVVGRHLVRFGTNDGLVVDWVG